MNRTGGSMGYFYAQLKRGMRWLPAMLLVTALLAGILGVFLISKLSGQNDGTSRGNLILGITGDTSDDYFQMGMRIVEEMDNTRDTVTFEFMDETTARAALERQDIHGYLVIPDDFITSVMRGENKKAILVTGTAQENIGMLLVREIADTVSVLLTESQTGIYAYSDYVRENLGEGPSEEQIIKLNLRYFDLILPRDEIYELDTPDSMTVLSKQGYYVCAVFVLFVLFLGIAGCPLLIRGDDSLSRMLLIRGRGPLYQCLSEYGAWCVTMLAVYGMLSLVLIVPARLAGEAVPELSGMSLMQYLGMAVSFVWLVPVICAMEYFLCQAAKSLLSGLLLCFCCAAALGYLTGCFYPLSFWPEAVQKAVAILPTGLLMDYMGRILTGEQAALLVPGLLLWLMAFLVFAWGLRKWELSR